MPSVKFYLKQNAASRKASSSIPDDVIVILH